MTASLISITPDAEALILYIARVSSNQDNTDTGLLRYLINHKHWSPFEHAHATVEFITTKDVAIQMLRHRSFSFQEFSQRYASPSKFVLNRGRYQAEKNRQSSTDEVDIHKQEWWEKIQKGIYYQALDAYQVALDHGISRECARAVLPMATETKLYMTGSIRSWIHYFELRCDEHTQKEHRDLALEARQKLVPELPWISEALGWDSNA
jgi:thymidylate synthase (FAD)